MTGGEQQYALVLERDRTCQLIGRIPGHVCPKDRINGRLTVMHIPPEQYVKRLWGELWRRYEHHHLTEEQNRLRVTPLGVVTTDPDLALLGCWGGHHDFDYNGKRFHRDLLPDFIEARVAYYGLEPELDRLFRDVRPQRREAA